MHDARLRTLRSDKWTRYPPDVLPAFVAEMDFPLPPPVKAALRAAVERDDTGYLPPTQPWLAEAFAGFAARRHGWSVDPAHVTAVADVMVGVTEILRVITEPGDGVVITPPVYPPFFMTIRQSGRRVVEAPLADDFGLDLDAIERAFAAGARALLLCSPHNPTGRVHPRAELEALAALADRHGAWVIADEIHSPLTHAGAEHVPFLTVAGERAFALASPSKAFNVAALKLALVITASDRAADFPVDLYDRCGLLGALAAEAAYNDADAWLDELLVVLDGNRRRLATLLAEQLPGVGYRIPDAGYLAWLDCRALGLGENPSAAFLERGRVALNPGLDFGTQGAGFARLNFGTTPDLLEAIVARLAAVR